ncbi:histidine kinase [Pseudoflavitalea sp. G-6-1-2]|uniref:sensor histidine kinase n=1 Tax=Pseudoflavitalea sp. G-6-1-2 TaxID=2728841 RepID=UPI00146D3759|nr:histidine kinase [Pseudoflavitalea sp. G-6-1-2]NML20004.1 histidine kinase [Pseudoflavitalea sp. G-6-1-2]
MNKARQLSVVQAQWIIWIILLGLNIVSLLPYDPIIQAGSYSLLFIVSYVITFYGNAFFLLPRLYERGHKLLYILCSLVFVIAITLGRFFASYFIYSRFFAKEPSFFQWAAVINSALSITLVFISGILFRIAMNYFRLRRKQEELQKKNAETELNLLKAQVQPHFLFNTLNNIYATAHRESPATAALLEQLSAIMRYFVDEAPKNKVHLSEELKFVKGYIELEKLRMRFPLEVTIADQHIDQSIELPPMMLIPLVENVFKHGIDKRRNDNFIELKLTMQSGFLFVQVRNRIAHRDESSKSGKGLTNLQSRLDLIYGADYSLVSAEEQGIYRTQLNIPI